MKKPQASSSRQSRKNSVSQNHSHPELFQPLEARRLMSITPAVDFTPDVASTTVSGFSPSQISTAYGLTGLTFASGKTSANGAGQTIAIVDAYNDPNISSDLKTFDARFGLASANLKVVNQTGGSVLPASNGGWAEEISLDVEWVHAVAPGANILLVETSSSSTADLLAGVNFARGVAGVSVVSMSWGGSEFSGQTSYDSDFTTPSGHTGETFIAASGDGGSADGVDWPASSPEVLSVGGSDLTLTSSGAYSSETGWSGSTGGVSLYEGEPEYQAKVQSLDARTVPDVAADADPYTGVAVYDSYSYDGVNGWVEFGGTSAAAPQWAGMIAIADQGRTISSLGTLDGATNTLPTLYSLEATSSTYSSDFHDITSGASSRSIGAGTGYDLVTGIGSAKANNLIPALVSSKTTTKLTLTAAPVIYAPPPPPWARGGFVVNAGGEMPTQLIADASSSFSTTTPAQVDPIAFEQAMFETSLQQTTQTTGAANFPAETSTAPMAGTFIGNNTTATGASAITASWFSQFSTPLVSIGSQIISELDASTLHNSGQVFAGIGTVAGELVSHITSDLSAQWAGVVTEVADSPARLFEAVGGSGLRTTAGGVGLAVAFIAFAQSQSNRENKRQASSLFSSQLIEQTTLA